MNMINRLEFNNIRLFSNNSASFALPKLTVFCGTNSCGKSTILKTILLLQQSQSPLLKQGALRFTGEQVDLGNYESFVTNNNVKKHINIKIELTDTIPFPILSNILKILKPIPSLSMPSLQKKYKTDKKIPYILKTSLMFFNPSTSSIDENVQEIASVSGEGILKSSEWAMYIENQKVISWNLNAQKEKTKNKYNLIIPTDCFSPDINEKDNRKNLIFEVGLTGLNIARIAVKPTANKEHLIDLPFFVYEAMNDFNRVLRRVNYIAPLRAPAQRYYLTNLEVGSKLDSKGDFLPYILGGQVDEPEIIHTPPKFKKPIKQTLTMALNGWLYYLRTGNTYHKPKQNEFTSSQSKGVLVEIGLRGIRGNTTHSLADSGFGYSQVLPILVRCLTARKGSTTLIEQPELHLNPALQVRLADFFISMLYSDKQLIIETHSEYIVNALRVRVAEDSKRHLSKNAIIYYIDLEKNQPVIHKMNINNDGTIPSWPKSFFGEAANLTGTLLRAQKRVIKMEKKTT